MFDGHIIDPFFIEAACVFLVVFGLFTLVCLFWGIISKLVWSERYRQNAKKKEFLNCLVRSEKSEISSSRLRKIMNLKPPVSISTTLQRKQ